MFGDIFGDYCNANKHSLTSTFVRGLLTVDGGEQEEKRARYSAGGDDSSTRQLAVAQP